MIRFKKITTSLVIIAGLSNSLVASPEVKEQIIEGFKEQENLLDDIRASDKKSDAILQAIKEESARIRKVINEQKPLQDKWIKAMEEFEKSEEVFLKHLQEIFLHNGTELLPQLLMTEDLKQFLDSLQAAQNIVAIDKSVCDDFQQKADDVKESKKVYDEKLVAIEEKIKAFQQRKDEILDNISDQKEKLRALELFEKEHEAEMNEVIDERLQTGNLTWNGRLAFPVRNHSISSGYGMRNGTMHRGVDLQRAGGDSLGAPVLAAATGKVVESKPSGGYGWLIRIWHGNKNGQPIYTCYAHSWPKQVLVRPGQVVKAGEQITSIGSYGDSTGPHLHFEVRLGSTAVNPMNYLR